MPGLISIVFFLRVVIGITSLSSVIIVFFGIHRYYKTYKIAIPLVSKSNEFISKKLETVVNILENNVLQEYKITLSGHIGN
jgi:hypothetical protein